MPNELQDELSTSYSFHVATQSQHAQFRQTGFGKSAPQSPNLPARYEWINNIPKGTNAIRNGEFLSSQHDCGCLGKIRGQLSTTNVNISGIKAKKNLPGKQSGILGMSSSAPSLEGVSPTISPWVCAGPAFYGALPRMEISLGPLQRRKAPGSSLQMLRNIQPLLLDPTPMQIPKAFLRNFRGTVNTGLQETAILRVLQLMRWSILIGGHSRESICSYQSVLPLQFAHREPRKPL